MDYDLLIRHGWVIDPANGVDAVRDIGVLDGRIAAVACELHGEATEIVDARGLLVTPGLIDLHTHCYWGATYWGIEADPVAARSGVTTWLDAGSAGAYTFPGFRRYVAEASAARIYALLNVSSIGLTANTGELATIDYCDVELGEMLVAANRDLILGIKARIDRNTTGGTGIEPLRRARELADAVGLPLMVHIALAPPELAAIAEHLRPGDILTHCCTGSDNRLISDDRHVIPSIRQLWEQGLVLDLGHGTGSFSFAVARALLEAGMPPDVISTDIHQMSVLGPMYDLPTTLSKFMAMGMSVSDVIARATVRPAAAMRHPELGTLSVGAPADIAVFRLEDGDFTYYDVTMEALGGDRRLVNVATYVSGRQLARLPERPSALWVARDMPEAQKRVPR